MRKTRIEYAFDKIRNGMVKASRKEMSIDELINLDKFMNDLWRQLVEMFYCRKLAALREISVRLGYVEKKHRKNKKNPRKALLEYAELADAAILVLIDPDSHPINKAGARGLLDICDPDWRDRIPSDLVGHAVGRNDALVWQWKNDVLKRDGRRCTKCGSTSKLNVHHVAAWKDCPSLRVSVSNGVTLCFKCHCKEHGKRCAQQN